MACRQPYERIPPGSEEDNKHIAVSTAKPWISRAQNFQAAQSCTRLLLMSLICKMTVLGNSRTSSACLVFEATSSTSVSVPVADIDVRD